MKSAASRSMKAELDALETRMGELASLLSEMADALTSYPECIRIVESGVETGGDTAPATMNLNPREWPSIQEIEQLLTNWRQLRDMADRT